jgi:hypothetical protein
LLTIVAPATLNNIVTPYWTLAGTAT